MLFALVNYKTATLNDYYYVINDNIEANMNIISNDDNGEGKQGGILQTV